METPATALALWDRGRLAWKAPPPRIAIEREQALMGALGVGVAVVFALFVAVLEDDVHRGELRHAQERAQAVAVVDTR